MDKFDLIGEAVLSAVLAGAFAFECAWLYFSGKMGFIIFLPLAWIFGTLAWGNIKALRK